MGRFPSGQRGQTVNLLATPSKVRILLHGRTDAKADRREFRYAKTDGSYGRERTSKEGEAIPGSLKTRWRM